jgi:predicted RNA-binding protein with TRAM domain
MKDTATGKIKPVVAISGISLLLLTIVATVTSGIASAGSATATRTLPDEPVSAGESFSITIEVSEDVNFGQVIETFPKGFIYRTSTLSDSQFEDISGWAEEHLMEYIFTLLGETSFTYTVIAPNAEGIYTISGILKVVDDEYAVDGDTVVEVEEAEEEEETELTATRTLPEEPVSAGARFTVEIEASHYGDEGHVVETLPEGFVYVDSTHNPERVEVEDSTVEFTLRGEPSFTYTVTASDTEGTYTFSGKLEEYDISGDTEIEVGERRDRATRTAPNITSWKPVEAAVNNAEGESMTFNISVSRTVTISWQINGTEVQTNESVSEARYTNRSAVIGTWNVSAITTSTTTGLSDMHTWIWRVTHTPAATPAITITSTPTPPPSVTPTPIQRASPTPASTPTPAEPPGFDAGFVFASLFAVAYLLLHRKKCTKSHK